MFAVLEKITVTLRPFNVKIRRLSSSTAKLLVNQYFVNLEKKTLYFEAIQK